MRFWGYFLYHKPELFCKFVQNRTQSSNLYKMLVTREISEIIKNSLSHFPIVILTGARQTGKTTLAKMLSNKPYYNLENPDTRQLAQEDPRLFLSKIKDSGAIIDEFQHVPELASYLQGIVDEQGKTGMFILTGSNNFLLMEKVSQSLAGRAAVFKLMPFSLNELSKLSLNLPTNELLLKGFYPAVHARAQNPTISYSAYYQTYLERDVRLLINIKDMFIFQRFIKLCAGRIGQLINYDQLAGEVGVSGKVIKTWLSVLEASHIIYLLPPFYKNIKKRLIKTPKLYFNDTGLAAYLLGVENISHIENHPLRGHLFENMVINEYLKYRFNSGKENNSFFYRDNHKNEVDLIIEPGNRFISAEIKSAQTYHSHFKNTSEWLAKQLVPHKVSGFIVYDGQQEWENDDLYVVNFRNFIKKIKTIR
jgi:uncharacterized protein